MFSPEGEARGQKSRAEVSIRVWSWRSQNLIIYTIVKTLAKAAMSVPKRFMR